MSSRKTTGPRYLTDILEVPVWTPARIAATALAVLLFVGVIALLLWVSREITRDRVKPPCCPCTECGTGHNQL